MRIRSKLALTQGLVSVTALGGGWVLIDDPSGASMQLPPDWRPGSPFDDFLIPGIVLFTVIGIGHLAGLLVLGNRWKHAASAGIALGTSLIVFVACELLWFPHHFWLQPFYIAVGLFEIVLSVLLWRDPLTE